MTATLLVIESGDLHVHRGPQEVQKPVQDLTFVTRLRRFRSGVGH